MVVLGQLAPFDHQSSGGLDGWVNKSSDYHSCMWGLVPALVGAMLKVIT